jgi:soluble lytic murein transglycosylase-like protein
LSLSASLRVLSCLGAGGLIAAGCIPTERAARAPASAVQAHETAAAPTPDAQPATFAERLAPLASRTAFAERFASLPRAAAVPGGFGAALAYAAPAPAGAGFERLDEAFPFALRGTERASASPPPMPRPAPAREEAATRGIDRAAPMRVASLDPAVALPAEETAAARELARAKDIPALVTAMAHKHGVPVPLAHAVVRVESNYKPHLVGKGATFGLMQIKYPTARGMGFTGKPKDLFDPATNLEWGMRYLAEARRRAKGDLCGTVLRYQGGHYAAHMTRAASIYCMKVRRYMAAANAARTADASTSGRP